jgi:cytoskeletal protein CcmA (bactofilin family)
MPIGEWDFLYANRKTTYIARGCESLHLQGTFRARDAVEQSIIGRGVAIEGELSGAEDVVVQGRLHGTVHLPQHRFSLSESGSADVAIEAKHIVIAGEFHGEIQGAESVELRATARFQGSILCDRIAIDAGATVVGNIETISRDTRPTKSETPTASPQPVVEVAARAHAASIS